MSLNKLIQILGNFMTRKRSKGGRMAAIENLRVQLKAVQKEQFDKEAHRQVVRELISMMVLNLHKRGRPKKKSEGGFSHAI